MLRFLLLLLACALLCTVQARGRNAMAFHTESCSHNSTLVYCSLSANTLCEVRPHEQREQHAALAHGADELISFSNQPSTALLLALRLPPEERNYLFPRSYLPSRRYWCEIRTNEGLLLSSQEASREELHGRFCQARKTDFTEATRLLSSSKVKGGVAKMLLYMSESAVRLALEGKLQMARTAPFIFALGVEGCSTGLFSCFFRPSLCRPHHNSSSESLGSTRLPTLEATFNTELSWPSVLKRTMLVAISMYQRLHLLQPRVEVKVSQLLSQCNTMDQQGRISVMGERHIASPGGTQAMAMHVRRGDACETLAISMTNIYSPRRCFPMSEYMRAAEVMRSLYGIERILLITDSPNVTSWVKRSRQARKFEWQWLELDRGSIGGDASQNLHKPKEKRVYIEHRAAKRNPSNALQVESMVADLRFSSEASVVIGTSRSFVTHAIQMVMWARSGVLPPVISLEGDPIYTLLHVRGKFWTRADKKRGDDRGWLPCPYARPNTPANCFSCQNLTMGEGATCLDDSFAAQALGLAPGSCSEWGEKCAALKDHVIY